MRRSRVRLFWGKSDSFFKETDAQNSLCIQKSEKRTTTQSCIHPGIISYDFLSHRAKPFNGGHAGTSELSMEMKRCFSSMHGRQLINGFQWPWQWPKRGIFKIRGTERAQVSLAPFFFYSLRALAYVLKLSPGFIELKNNPGKGPFILNFRPFSVHPKRYQYHYPLYLCTSFALV